MWPFIKCLTPWKFSFLHCKVGKFIVIGHQLSYCRKEKKAFPRLREEGTFFLSQRHLGCVCELLHKPIQEPRLLGGLVIFKTYALLQSLSLHLRREEEVKNIQDKNLQRDELEVALTLLLTLHWLKLSCTITSNCNGSWEI